MLGPRIYRGYPANLAAALHVNVTKLHAPTERGRSATLMSPSRSAIRSRLVKDHDSPGNDPEV